MASTRPSGDPKRKKSETSNSNRPRLTSERLEILAGAKSASSFSTLEWMLDKKKYSFSNNEPGIFFSLTGQSGNVQRG